MSIDVENLLESADRFLYYSEDNPYRLLVYKLVSLVIALDERPNKNVTKDELINELSTIVSIQNLPKYVNKEKSKLWQENPTANYSDIDELAYQNTIFLISIVTLEDVLLKLGIINGVEDTSQAGGLYSKHISQVINNMKPLRKLSAKIKRRK